MTPPPLSPRDLARHLDDHRLTGAVATPREANLRNIQGFLDGDPHQHMGVLRTRDWSYDDVFALMRDRVGISPDRAHVEGQDTISAGLAVAALERYARASCAYTGKSPAGWPVAKSTRPPPATTSPRTRA